MPPCCTVRRQFYWQVQQGYNNHRTIGTPYAISMFTKALAALRTIGMIGITEHLLRRQQRPESLRQVVSALQAISTYYIVKMRCSGQGCIERGYEEKPTWRDDRRSRRFHSHQPMLKREQLQKREHSGTSARDHHQIHQSYFALA